MLKKDLEKLVGLLVEMLEKEMVRNHFLYGYHAKILGKNKTTLATGGGMVDNLIKKNKGGINESISKTVCKEVKQ